jgi:2,3-bisphosphoglycerate-independent phosphoglycerate mutase
VPIIVIDPDDKRPMRSGGALCDVGPTLLTMLGLERPKEMTGMDLRLKGERA